MQKALKYVKKHPFLVGLFVVILILILTSIIRKQNEVPTWTTDKVSQGTVRNLVSVSGSIEAVGSAELAFPTTGIVESITVKEGDQVKKGQVLATLMRGDVGADYKDAEASVRIARADLDELLNGLRPEAIAVTKTKLDIAKEARASALYIEEQKVKNALTTLLSSGLEAVPLNKNNLDTPPVIGGTYTCAEGTYTIDVFSSAAQSGYSYRFSGAESGSNAGYEGVTASFGKCGLTILFAEGENYGNSKWTIEIPNKRNSLYITNYNNYLLAQASLQNADAETAEDVRLAEQNLTLDSAEARSEARIRAEAKLAQAEARLAGVGSNLRDHEIIAPFDGTITDIVPVVGETVGASPVITMVSPSAFALTALIPEIDITKVKIGQKADVLFDARPLDTFKASTIFISPLAKMIDGVSYFETKLVLDDTSIDWLRSGLNADVDIVIDERENVTRIPKRYLIDKDGTKTVLMPNDKETRSVPVDVVFTGNDGFIEVKGVNVGDTIIAP